MNNNEYLDLFLEESREHLLIMNDVLLKLEQQSADNDSLNELFRSAHTLKGMSATMGFEKITELTHKMENLLGKIRDKEILFSQVIGDLLFKCVDKLEEMIEDISVGNDKAYDISDLLKNLVKFDEEENINIESSNIQESKSFLEVFNDTEKILIEEGIKRNLNTYKIVIEISPKCVMKAVRVFMVFKKLEEIGDIIKSIPTAEELEDEKFGNDFTVFLISKENKEIVEKNIIEISEISKVNIEGVALDKNEEEKFSKDEEKSNDVKDINKVKTHQTVRVDIGKLDNLMNLVGELVINKTRLEQIYRTNDLNALNETLEQIDRITSDLQNVVMNVRMVPIEQVFNRFPRMVRDLSKELGKDVDLIMEGKETELDRTVIDEIGDPLVHLLRNAIDHGLESPQVRATNGKNRTGTIRLIAKQEGNSVVIIVKDDGQGIDHLKVKNKAIEKGIITMQEAEKMEPNNINNLIFSPGFSTAQEITDISGRGVGLDVVKSKIQSLSGNVYVESKLGEGTTFIIKLPLTLAIIQALLVKVEKEIYAVPLANIDETTCIESNSIKKVQGKEVMVLRGKVLPLLRLAQALETTCEIKNEDDELYVVVVRKGEQQIGLIVNDLIGQQEIVITSLGKLLSNIPGIAGAAVLGDGKVSLILDVGTLI